MVLIRGVLNPEWETVKQVGTVKWGASLPGAGAQCERRCGADTEVRGMLKPNPDGQMGGGQRVGQRVLGAGGVREQRSGGPQRGLWADAESTKLPLLLKPGKETIRSAFEKKPSACQQGQHSLPSWERSPLGVFLRKMDRDHPTAPFLSNAQLRETALRWPVAVIYLPDPQTHGV